MKRFAAIAFVAAIAGCGDAGPYTLTVRPATLSLNMGTTAQLTTAMTDANGQTVIPTSLNWATSAPAVATVNAEGLLTAIKGGTATITATASPSQGTSMITVIPIADGKWSGTTEGTTLYFNLSVTQQGEVGGMGTLTGAHNGSLGVAGTFQNLTLALTCPVDAVTGGTGSFVFNGTLSADGLTITGKGTGAGLSGTSFTLTRL